MRVAFSNINRNIIQALQEASAAAARSDAAFDPSATLAVHCGNDFDAGCAATIKVLAEQGAHDR
jgi:hypothetical protein